MEKNLKSFADLGDLATKFDVAGALFGIEGMLPTEMLRAQEEAEKDRDYGRMLYAEAKKLNDVWNVINPMVQDVEQDMLHNPVVVRMLELVQAKDGKGSTAEKAIRKEVRERAVMAVVTSVEYAPMVDGLQASLDDKTLAKIPTDVDIVYAIKRAADILGSEGREYFDKANNRLRTAGLFSLVRETKREPKPAAK